MSRRLRKHRSNRFYHLVDGDREGQCGGGSCAVSGSTIVGGGGGGRERPSTGRDRKGDDRPGKGRPVLIQHGNDEWLGQRRADSAFLFIAGDFRQGMGHGLLDGGYRLSRQSTQINPTVVLCKMNSLPKISYRKKNPIPQSARPGGKLTIGFLVATSHSLTDEPPIVLA